MRQLFGFVFATTLLCALAGRPVLAQPAGAYGAPGAVNQAAPPPRPSAARREGSLVWANGETLPGRLIGAEGNQFRWQSSLFVDPLIINANYLQRITFPHIAGDDKPPEPFRVVLRNGDVLYGKLRQIDGDRIVVTAARHGELTLDRAAVRSLRRVDSPSLIYLGPNGTAGWRAARAAAGAIAGGALPWVTSPEGHLNTRRARAELFREIAIPGQAEIEVSIASSNMPQFLLAFGEDATNTVRVETWADELVALSGDNFEHIKTMQNATRQIDLRLYWNQQTGLLAVYSKTGQKLCTLQGAKPMGKKFGIYLQNKSTDLRLQKIRVSKWNGQPPREVRPGEARVHLANGDIVYGTIQAFAAADGKLKLGDAQAELAIDQVSSIHLNDGANARSNELVQAMYHDGSLLTGEVVGVVDGAVTLRTSYSSQPIEAKLGGARQLAFRPKSAPPADGRDKLYHEVGVSSGTLIGGDRPGAAVLWRPVGAANASPLAPGSRGRFVRAKPASGAPSFNPDVFHDLLFLVSRDIVPCRVVGIDDKFVDVELAIGDVKRVPHDQIQAIELGSPGDGGDVGFARGGWETDQRNDGNVVQNGGRVTFSGRGSFGHRSMLRGDVVRFQLRWNRQRATMITVRMFSEEAGATGPAFNLCFYCAADQIRAAIQNQGRLSFTGQVVRAELGRAQVEMRIRGTSIETRINDTLTHKASIDRRSRTGRGIVFTNDIANQLSNSATGEITVSGFNVSGSLRVQARHFVDDEAKQHALTIPRFRRQSPFTHVLLAPNGDLLRGRLLGLRDGRLRFQSRLDAFTFPRERIAAIVWLQKPLPPPGEGDAENAADENKPPEDETAETVGAEAAGGEAAAGVEGGEIEAGEAGEIAATTGGEAESGEAENKPAGDAAGNEEELLIRVLFRSGEIVVIHPHRMNDEHLFGESPVLGKCAIPVNAIHEVHVGGFGPLDDRPGYADWQPRHADEPKFAGTSGSSGVSPAEAALIGTPAKDFQLRKLEGGTFRLADHSDKVVVLDFWASWCGPCVRALPQYLKVVDGFKKKNVLFVGVNQEETPATIRRFLENRDLKFPIALDLDLTAAGMYRVDGIPHTVVIGKGGKIEWVHIGFRRGAVDELQKTLERLTAEPAPQIDPPEREDGEEAGAVGGEDSAPAGTASGAPAAAAVPRDM